MIQFYTMPLSAPSHMFVTRVVISCTGDAEKDTEGLQRIKALMWTGSLLLEMSRADWVELQAATEMWGMTTTDVPDKCEALRFASAIEELLSGEPSRVIEETAKVDVPVVVQRDLFGNE